jgi:hypothetical protein
MGITTGWLDPPNSIGGLDHLGTQAPCILVYSQLLPGITNVTDRARYYSFYPWLIWSFDKRFPKADYAKFVETYRRADCLFTLIAERHARCTDGVAERHGTAMVGRNALVPALTELEAGKPLALSSFSAQESKTRYFKNRMGGLGQYYSGMLADLEILEARPGKWITYSKERGAPIAESFDKHVESDLFWKTCERDSVTAKVLDQLESFCPCNLAKGTLEHRHLQALFFSQKPYNDEAGDQRRKTLAMLLHLADALASSDTSEDLTQAVFRGCIYTGHLRDQSTWSLPVELEKVRVLWAVYERGDLLSIAFQGLLATALFEMERQGPTYPTVEAFIQDFMSSELVHKCLEQFSGPTLEEEIQRFLAEGPALENWGDDEHEIQRAAGIVKDGTDPSAQSERLPAAFGCLIAILARDRGQLLDYSGVGLTDDVLADYPINLVSFRVRTKDWLVLPVADVLAKLMQWALHTHLRVALRKLRQTGQSSFRFRPSELGFEIVDVPSPTFTIPRFNQAIQVLRDIGMVNRNKDGISGLTALGRRQLDASLG